MPDVMSERILYLKKKLINFMNNIINMLMISHYYHNPYINNQMTNIWKLEFWFLFKKL